MPSLSRIVIATRESALALWQAHHIQDKLRLLYPETLVSVLAMTTQGDQILDKTLAKIGGKGLFVKELELALQENRADLAVHSLKDVPMTLPEGFSLVAIGAREDPRDAFISNKYTSLQDLPHGAIIGTSSLRREAQLRARYPHLQIQPLRGNVQTRLKKLDENQYDAIILAAAGLIRLNLAQRITTYLSVEDSLPAAGQGALGIEICNSRPDLVQALHALHHEPTASCVLAERALSRALNGSCQVPLGAYAEWQNKQIYLRAFVASPDGSTLLRAQGLGLDPDTLGLQVANDLLAQGASRLLALAQL